MVASSIRWVAGDPRAHRLYLGLSVTIRAVAALLGVLAFLALLVQANVAPGSLSGAWTGVSAFSLYVTALAAGPALLDLLYLRKLPGSRPGCVSLGVATGGIAVRLPISVRFFRWTEVQWVDPQTLDLSRKRTKIRLRLTPAQSEAIGGTLRRPLASGLP